MVMYLMIWALGEVITSSSPTVLTVGRFKVTFLSKFRNRKKRWRTMNRYKIKRCLPETKITGDFSLPERIVEVDVSNQPIYLLVPDITPPGVLWLEVWDNWTGELLYRWPKEK
jgi:hypothetical protein